MTTPPKQLDLYVDQARMVNWFNPLQLIQIAIRALIGTVFGAHIDRREVEAALSQDMPRVHDYSKRDVLWFDYTADLGDGWDSGYSIAWLLAQPQLEAAGRSLPRGEFLIMGGDEVYPIASRDAYQQKLCSPYAAALPWSEDANAAPVIFALPGNHDWYDGLTSFLRVFCQQRWIGGWRTRQQRSYFAIKLPHDWWLWAVDIQLEGDIDAPQKAYFESLAEQLGPGSKVIICPAVSSWVEAGDPRIPREVGQAGDHPNLQFLEQRIAQSKATLKLSLSGDLHHYSHYIAADGSCHRITAGGGGAFLHGTHDLPDTLVLQEAAGEKTYARKIEYPSQPTARGMRWRNLLFCFYNPAFSLLLAGVYLLLIWVWQAASGVSSPCALDAWHVFRDHPGAVLLLLLPIGGMWGFASAPPRAWQALKKAVWGLAHGCAHVGVAALLWWLAAQFSMASPTPWQVLLIVAGLIPLGMLLGGTLFGVYLAASSTFSGMHDNDVFASLHSADYKNFLRLRVDAEGLTIYPFKLERACRSWRLSSAASLVKAPGWLASRVGRRLWRFKVAEQQAEAWFAPASGQIEVALIEAPIQLR
ncbi:hypothetical protein [Uliginosibacterium sediminicola]|uniref:Metallophosphoesterase n=1 Tax=Uliginosibacterium sediminicola TaxID=2024550 RepID=A0ABU9YT98_9RHOO